MRGGSPRTPKRLTANETGFAAIVVALIILLVVSLITLGFAQLARREQQQALNQQLSTQAFYAAETGINDAVKIANGLIASGNPVPNKPDCNNTGAYAALSPDLGNGTSYSCVLVNTDGASGQNYLEYQPESGQSSVVPINPTGGSMDTLIVKWRPFTTSGNVNNCPASGLPNPSVTAWNCPYPALRVDLVPTAGANVNSGAGLTRYYLLSKTLTAYLRPGNAGSATPLTYDSSSVPQGVTITADQCDSNVSATPSDTGPWCKATIKIAAADANNFTSYGLRLMPLYGSTGTSNDLRLFAYQGGESGTQLHFAGAQVVVDATGKAQNVLRRIQVRIGTTSPGASSAYPDFALETNDSVCKRYQYSAPPATPHIGSSVGLNSDQNSFCHDFYY